MQSFLGPERIVAAEKAKLSKVSFQVYRRLVVLAIDTGFCKLNYLLISASVLFAVLLTTMAFSEWLQYFVRMVHEFMAMTTCLVF